MSAEELALYQLPRFKNGQVEFECLFPSCKAKLVLLGVNSAFQGHFDFADDLHSCLHDSHHRNACVLLGHAALGGDPVNWITERTSALKTVVLRHHKNELFCFNSDLNILTRDFQTKGSIRVLFSQLTKDYNQTKDHQISRLQGKVKQVLQRMGVELSEAFDWDKFLQKFILDTEALQKITANGEDIPLSIFSE